MQNNLQDDAQISYRAICFGTSDKVTGSKYGSRKQTLKVKLSIGSGHVFEMCVGKLLAVRWE